MNPTLHRIVISWLGAFVLFLFALALIMMNGCASSQRSYAVAKTVGTQDGQPVNIVTTTQVQSEGTIGPDPTVLEPVASSVMGVAAQFFTGGALGTATGLAALWLREKKLHAATAASDNVAWNKLADIDQPTVKAGV